MLYKGEQLNTVNSFFKSTMGIGNILGLFIGTILYIYGGYCLPFIVYGIVFIAMTPLVFILIPADLSQHKKRVEEISKSEEDSQKVDSASETPTNKEPNDVFIDKEAAEIEEAPALKKNSSLLSLIRHKNVLKYLFFASFDMCMLNFSPAILSKRLEQLGISKNLNGIFFALPFVFPAFSAIIYIKLQKKIQGHVWIMIGKMIMAVGFLFTGPSYFLYFPDHIAVLIFGISILGFSASFNVIPLFPLMMIEIKKIYCMGDSKVSDLASGLYTASFGLGCIIGPLSGAYLEWLFGFRITTDILANITFILLAIMLMTSEYKKM
jgi:predicted MFS family arabinose efflux permease